MLNLNNIYKKYKNNSNYALNDISIDFDNTGFVFILGKSGSGKSTLLNIIGGLDKYDSGSITFLGKKFSDFSNIDYDSYRNTYVGFVFQEYNLIDDYNVYENIAISLKLQNKEINEEELDNLLKELDIYELKYRKVNELSGGQKQRVAIARSLIKKPRIILADEPTGNLDTATGNQVMQLLSKISSNILVIVVSHNNELAEKYADRIIKISDGKIIEDNSFLILNTDNVNKKFKLIKSKMSIWDCIKFGFRAISTKKIRFIFTMFLTSLALFICGIMITISNVKVEKIHSNLLSNQNEQYIFLQKGNREEKTSFFSNDDISLLSNNITEYNTIKESINDNYSNITYNSIGIDFPNIDGEKTPLYYVTSSNEKLNIVEVDNKTISEEIIGKLPYNDDEVAISNYIADHIIKYGIKDYDGNIIKSNSYNDILKKEILININNKPLKITGIVKYDISKYQAYKDKIFDDLNEDEKHNFDGINQVLIYKRYYVFNNIFLSNKFFLNQDFSAKAIVEQENGVASELSFLPLNEAIEYYDGSEVKETNHLDENEMIINLSIVDASLNNKIIEYENKNNDEDLKITKLKEINEVLNDSKIINQIVKVSILDENNNIKYSKDNVKIIGAYISTSNMKYSYMNDKIINNYLNSNYQVSKVVVKTDNISELEDYFKEYSFENADDNSIVAKSPYSNNIELSMNTLNLIKKISSYISIALIIFSILLIYNFIVSSIAIKRKDIGILRGLGANKNDVFKIFIHEGLLLSLLSILVSFSLIFPAVKVLNKIFSTSLRMDIRALFIDLRLILIIVAITVVLTIISSLIPIYKISSETPIEAIKNK